MTSDKLLVQFLKSTGSSKCPAVSGIEIVPVANDDDALDGGDGGNTLSGGDGSDTWSTAGGTMGVEINMVPWSTTAPIDQANSYGGTDSISEFENAEGGEGNDEISGDDRDNVLTGRGGDDTFVGGDGFDTVLFADNGDQGISVDLWAGVNDVRTGLWLDAFGGSDTVDRATVEAYRGTSAADNMKGDGGGGSQPWTKSIFFGEGGDDTLLGSGLDDQLDGGDGDDTITGQGGDDMLSGGDGDDVIFGGETARIKLRVNTGGAEIKDPVHAWQTDTQADPNFSLTNPDDTDVSTPTATVFYKSAAVDGAPEALFESALNAISQGNHPMVWELPVYGGRQINPGPNGTGLYRVTVFLVEGDAQVTQPDQTLMGVEVEGT